MSERARARRRQRARETERQRDRETARQRDRYGITRRWFFHRLRGFIHSCLSIRPLHCAARQVKPLRE